MKKRLLSVLICLCIIVAFAVAPIEAFAAEEVPIVCNLKEIANFAYNNGDLVDGDYIIGFDYGSGSAGWIYEVSENQLVLCNTIYEDGGHTFTTIAFKLNDGSVEHNSVVCGLYFDNGVHYIASSYIDRESYEYDEDLQFVASGDVPFEIRDSVENVANGAGVALLKCANTALSGSVKLNLGDLGFTAFTTPTHNELQTGHDFGEWVVVKEPTDKEKGSKERKCAVCGATETQDIPKKESSSGDDSEISPSQHSDTCPSTKFTDVDKNESNWTHKPIDYVLEKGYMSGTSTTAFEPNKTVSRAMVVQVLYAMEGKPAVIKSAGFKDVESGKWYADAVNWAANNGIVAGYTDGKFGINDPVKRQDLVAIMYKYAVYKKYDAAISGDISVFADKDAISSYAVNGMKWGVGHGIISGIKDGNKTNAQPKATASRAQLAVILKAFDQNVKK